MDLCRDELKAVKTMNQQLRREKETLENEKFEQKSMIERMEKQRRSFSRPNENSDQPTAAHKELQSKYEVLVTENDQLKV